VRVGILGAGAMGSLFGGLLARAGEDVWFVDPWRAQIDAITRDGLLMTCDGEQRRVAAGASVDPAAAGMVDLLMVWCKAFATGDAVAAAAPMIGPQTIVCSLQNGLGNPEQIRAHVPAERVVHGVTGLGASVVAPGVIEVTRGAWTGGSTTWIGGPGAEAVAETLRGAGMAMEVREDIDALVWNKVAMAGAMSPVASLVRLPNGLVLNTRETRELLEQMTREIVAVANAKGIALDADEAIARNVAVYETSLDHRPSMLDDVLAGRRTEIDSLCGAVVREGQALGVPVPVSATLWRLIRAIEQRYEEAVA